MDVRDGVPVRHCCIVETAVVPARAPSAVTFGHHMERGCPRAVGALDDAHSLHGGELGLGRCKFVGGKPAGMDVNWWAGRCDVVFDPVPGCGV